MQSAPSTAFGFPRSPRLTYNQVMSRQTPSPINRRSITTLGGLLIGLFALLSPAVSQSAEKESLAPGFRQLVGQHLTLVTDLPASDTLDDLPTVFDAAFQPWCDYFRLNAKGAEARQVDAQDLAGWHVTGYLMQSRERFQRAGYWQADLPDFLNGFSTGPNLWLYNQTSPYYRRHLLLHEGVHSFMYQWLGTEAPPWYLEGMAELLATHRWEDGQLEVGYFPRNSRELPGLGRIKLLEDQFRAGKPLSLTDVLNFDGRAHLKVEAYAWSWALCALLDGHPRYRERFRQLPLWLRERDFNTRFRRLFAKDWQALEAEWQVFVANMDYGYDFARMAIDFRPGAPLIGTQQVTVAADKGWQSSGIRLEAGHYYRLQAEGRYQVAAGPPAWHSEPGGVTIRYYRGRPLGQLLGALLPESAEADSNKQQPAATPGDGENSAAKLFQPGWGQPATIGLETVLAPTKSGTLYLRINESAADLADNAGQLTVRVTEQAAP